MMSYFDTTSHGWRVSNVSSAALPSFSGTPFGTRSMAFDGVNLYVTYAEDTSGDGYVTVAAGKTYKYTFNSSTNTFTYVSKIAVGGHSIVDDGSYLWVGNFTKVYRITKSSMAYATINVRTSDGTHMPLQKSLFSALGYIWAIEHSTSATTNQKLYRIDTAGSVTTFTPTWGIQTERVLCGANSLIWTNAGVDGSQNIIVYTFNPSTTTTTLVTLTYGSGTTYATIRPSFTGLGSTVNLTTTGSDFYIAFANQGYMSVAVVNAASTTITKKAVFSPQGLSSNGATLCTASTKAAAGEGRAPAYVAIDPTNGILFSAYNDSSYGCGGVHQLYFNNTVMLVADSNQYKTQAYGASVVTLPTNSIPLGGATYSQWQTVPASSITLGTRLGGLGSTESAYNYQHNLDVTVCKYGQYVLSVQAGYNTGTASYTDAIVTVVQLPARARDVVIRPHILNVGCNVLLLN